MRMTVILAFGLVVGLVAVGSAQTPAAPAGMKLTATMSCPKTDPTATAEVGDAPGHAILLFKVKCTYETGDIGGAKMQTEDDTFTTDMSGSMGRDSGYGVVTLASSDKAIVRFSGTTTFKNNMATAGQGTWSFTSGTGKAKGLKGKGTYKGTFKPDGSVTWQIDGDYTIPAAAAKK